MIDPLFLAFLAQHDDDAWLRVVDRLRPAIHPVDRAAVRVWMHFYPMRLQRALAVADDEAALADYLRLQGRWRLGEQRDTSHWFLFGHRYWPVVRDVVRGIASRPVAPGSLDLGAQIQAMARAAAGSIGADPSWLVAMTAIAVRMLQQVGLPEPPEGVSAAGRGTAPGPIGRPDEPPHRIVARREARRSQGWFGLPRGRPRRWTVTFDERPPARSFPIIDTQHLTTAAALDARDYRAVDARCTEGPIPVHCRSCSCGTCWVGVLAGADRLAPVEPREREALAALGYADTAEPQPDVRLACMAEARGPVTLVIPPWNGQVGVRLEKAARQA